MARRLAILACSTLLLGVSASAATVAHGMSGRGRLTRCALSAVGFQPGPLWSEETGQHTGTIVVANLSRGSCSLHGYPALSFLDARHQLLAFRIRHRGDQMITARPPQETLVRTGASQIGQHRRSHTQPSRGFG